MLINRHSIKDNGIKEFVEFSFSMYEYFTYDKFLQISELQKKVGVDKTNNCLYNYRNHRQLKKQGLVYFHGIVLNGDTYISIISYLLVTGCIKNLLTLYYLTMYKSSGGWYYLKYLL